MLRIILFIGKRKLEHYFPEYEKYKTPEDAKRELNESTQVTKAKYYIKNEFEVIFSKSSIVLFYLNDLLKMILNFLQKICKHTNHADHRLYPHFTCAVDTENIKRVFDDCRDSIQWKYLKEFDLL